jgi:hypothetical protein
MAFGNGLVIIGNGFDHFWIIVRNGYTPFGCNGYS